MSAIADTDEQVPTETYSEAAAEVFAGRMFQLLNDAALGLVLCMAHRTGLLGVLERLRIATCERIAQESGLNASAVHACLAALAHGRIVLFSPLDQSYCLPAEHAAFLARSSGTTLALAAESFSMLAELPESLRTGRVASARARTFRGRLADILSATSAADIREAVSLIRGADEKLRAGASVLGLQCGEGAVIARLAGEFPNSAFVGLSSSGSAVETARVRASDLGLSNASFRVANIAQAQDRAYDIAILCSAFHDERELPSQLAHVYRTLKCDGAFLMPALATPSRFEKTPNRPMAPLLHAIALLRGISTSSVRSENGSSEGYHSTIHMLHDAGFRHVRVDALAREPLTAYFICAKT